MNNDSMTVKLIYSGWMLDFDKIGRSNEYSEQSLTNIVINDVFWNVNRKYYSKLLELLRTLSYFEMYVINNKNNKLNITVMALLKQQRDFYMFQLNLI